MAPVTLQPMRLSANTYIGIVAISGVSVCLGAVVNWTSGDPLQLGFYLLFTLFSSQLKVTLPGVTGTMSVNFLFNLIAVTLMTQAESLIIASAGTLTQCLWRPKSRPRPVQVLFNVTSVAVTTAGCYTVYHSAWLRHLNDSVPMMLMWACASYFVLNTVSISLVIAITERKALWTIWFDNFFWTAPQYLFGACLAALNWYATRQFGWEITVLILPAIYLVYRSYRLYLGRLEQEQEHVAKVAELHLRTIRALALAIDAKDENTHDHLQRVQVYATAIGKDLGLTADEVQALQAASLLHDIGKLAVPEYIISKPGRLTPDEFEKMKIHTVVGAEILETVGFPYPVVPIVRSHHEKWDGTGYPDGLAGAEIPVGARILAAVDCLDALASDRPYRPALPLEDAMKYVESLAGSAFDPKVVAILKRRYQELEQTIRDTPSALGKLSMHIKIARGEAPAAGLEVQGADTGTGNADFTSAIASARQEIHTLLELTRELGNSLRVEDTFSLLASRLKSTIPHDTFAIYTLQHDALVPEYVVGIDAKLFLSLRIPLGQGLSGWVAENNKPILNGNPSVEPGYLNDPSKFTNLRSAIAIPLEGTAGVSGCLTLYSIKSDAFTKDQQRLLLAISSKSGMTIENALRFRQEQRSASTDELTGLPNARSLFVELQTKVNQCNESGERLTVLVLDLDGFKSVNDYYGHLEGNRLLKNVAAELRSLCRGSDYVARMGGDEFVVILRAIPASAVEARIAQMREMVVEQGGLVTGKALVSLSVGDATLSRDFANAEQLLAEADKRMYAMKGETKKGSPRQTIEMNR